MWARVRFAARKRDSPPRRKTGAAQAPKLADFCGVAFRRRRVRGHEMREMREMREREAANGPLTAACSTP
jgi:hypothetical protein